MTRRLWVAAIVVVLIAAALFIRSSPQLPVQYGDNKSSPDQPPPAARHTVTINEAARTLLYLPLYHATQQGYFRDAGLEVRIVTGGTATASVAAMLSGEADFAQADPMYVAISREKGADTKVVAQVVGRIALWAVTLDKEATELTAPSLRGRTIATHPRPMTAFTYTNQLIQELGLTPGKDVYLLTSAPGTEIAALFNGQARYMVTVEPNVSIAESKGARVVLSFARRFGDQVLTGLMTRETVIAQNRPMVVAIVRAYQRALNDIHSTNPSVLASAAAYFPSVDKAILSRAVKRLAEDAVFPTSVSISDESWNKALTVRLQAGDLKTRVPLSSACDLDIMRDAAQ